MARARTVEPDAEDQEYVVAHDGVGSYSRGQIVSKSHFHKDADIERLKRLGALVPTNTRDADDLLEDLPEGAASPVTGEPLGQLARVADEGKVPPPELTTGNPSKAAQDQAKAEGVQTAEQKAPGAKPEAGK